MRTLEILIPIILAGYLGWPKPRPLLVMLLPLATLLVVAVHLLLEGYRWEMVPLYLLTLSLSVTAVLGLLRKTEQKPGFPFVLLGLVVVFTAVPVLVPVPAVAKPAGPFAVGTRSFELIDPSRKEIWSGKDENRRLLVKLWYPALPAVGDKLAPWMDNALIYAPALAEYMGLPSFSLDHLALASTPAFSESKLAPQSGGYPLVLFSHGWKGFDSQNTGEALELASRGYVVAALQHTYGAIVTVFPDGSVAKNNPEALPDGAPSDVYEASAHRLVAQWTGDLHFALDFLEAQSAASTGPLAGAVDATRVGVYGHSTGAGAAIQFAVSDDRVKAVLGMDPFMRPVAPEVIVSGLTKPSFFLFSQKWTDDTASRNNQLFASFLVNTTGTLGINSITGTAHLDFCDLPLLSPLAPLIGLKGPISGSRVTEILNSYLVAFFDQTLQNKPSQLFAGQRPFAEVVARK